MVKTMTRADNFWYCMDEPANLMVITAFMEFEGPLDYKRLLATIDSRGVHIGNHFVQLILCVPEVAGTGARLKLKAQRHLPARCPCPWTGRQIR